MKLSKIRLKNYRCYKDLELELDPFFNVIVGINGTGKSSLLEAIRISIGSLFLDVNKINGKLSSPSFLENDVRIEQLEAQHPVSVYSEAELCSELKENKFINWERSQDKYKGRTTIVKAKEMKAVSSNLQQIVREKQDLNIPLVAYFSTDRYKKENKDTALVADGSRLRGYYNALDSKTNIKYFLDLLKTETLSDLQHSTSSPILSAVSNAVVSCIVDCKRIYHDVKRDELIIDLKSINDSMPFHSLSDGVRCTLAMVMEIAYRCCLLNPHLKENAALETSGVVLIDEIDLHLHPSWQKKVISDFRSTFPNIQFIVSTHAPLVIGSLKDGRIYNISENQIFDFANQYGRDANAILQEMDTNPMDDDLQSQLNSYFIMIESGIAKSSEGIVMRKELEERLGVNHAELQRADIMLEFFE